MFFIKKCIKRKLKWFLTTKNLSFNTNSCNNQQVNLFRFFQNKYLTKVSVKRKCITYRSMIICNYIIEKPNTTPIIKFFLDFIAETICKLTWKIQYYRFLQSNLSIVKACQSNNNQGYNSMKSHRIKCIIICCYSN